MRVYQFSAPYTNKTEERKETLGFHQSLHIVSYKYFAIKMYN